MKSHNFKTLAVNGRDFLAVPCGSVGSYPTRKEPTPSSSGILNIVQGIPRRDVFKAQTICRSRPLTWDPKEAQAATPCRSQVPRPQRTAQPIPGCSQGWGQGHEGSVAAARTGLVGAAEGCLTRPSTHYWAHLTAPVPSAAHLAQDCPA